MLLNVISREMLFFYAHMNVAMNVAFIYVTVYSFAICTLSVLYGDYI